MKNKGWKGRRRNRSRKGVEGDQEASTPSDHYGGCGGEWRRMGMKVCEKWSGLGG